MTFEDWVALLCGMTRPLTMVTELDRDRKEKEFLFTYGAFADWAEETNHPLAAGLREMAQEGKWPYTHVKKWCWDREDQRPSAITLPNPVFDRLRGLSHHRVGTCYVSYNAAMAAVEDAAAAFMIEGWREK